MAAAVKKVFWRNAEIFANVKKNLHGGECLPVFDFIDVAFALSQRKAHVPGRYFFLAAKLHESLSEKFFHK